MFRVWEYSEKGKSNQYKEERQKNALERLTSFSSEDPEMPYYCRDPKEIKRDPRYKQLNRHYKDVFNRLVDELHIHKGFLAINHETIAHLLELDSPDEAKDFLEKCNKLGLTKEENGFVYIPELREQYVRGVIKGEAKATNFKPKEHDVDENVPF